MFNRRMTERLIENFSEFGSENFEIQGAALRRHTTRSSLIKYKYYFSRYHFDYVLIYHGINDLWMNHVHQEMFSSDYSHFSPWNVRGWLLNKSFLARLIYNQILHKIFRPQPKILVNGTHYSSVDTFEHNIRETVRLIRYNGGSPILMTFAWYIPEDYTLNKFKKNMLDYNNPTSYDRCAVEMWGLVDYVKEGLSRHNSIIKKIAKEEKVLLIDQESRLCGHPEYFGDVVHLSEIGTDLFVKNIVQFFLKKNLMY